MPDAAHERVQRELFLRTLFDIPPPSELAELLAAKMKDRHFEAGDFIYERGQPSGTMVFIHRGTVELIAPGEEPWVYVDRAFIGAIDANMRRPHVRSARAVTALDAVEIHFEEYQMLLEDFFEFQKASLLQSARSTFETAMSLAHDELFEAPALETSSWLSHPAMDQVQRMMALRRAHAFESAPVQALVTLAEHADEIRLAEGETLFKAGAPNQGFMVLVKGLVEVSATSPKLRGRLGPGCSVPGIIALDPRPPLMTAVAATEAIVLRIAHEDLFDAFEEHADLIRAWWKFMGAETERIRKRLAGRSPTKSLLDERNRTQPRASRARGRSERLV